MGFVFENERYYSYGCTKGGEMKTRDAVIKRIHEICEQQKRTIDNICLAVGMSSSNIYALLKGRNKVPKVDTIKRFCEGAGITMQEFFTPEYFNMPYSDD